MASRFLAPLFDAGKGISPSDGARLFFFEVGTSDKRDTFKTEAAPLGAKNTNPVIADGNGVFPQIWITGTYKVILKDKNNVQKWEQDPVIELVNVSAATRSLETVAEMVAATGLVVGQFITVEDYATGNNSGVLFFKVVAAGTGVDDGGSFIDLTGSGFQAKQNFPEWRSCKQFGAVGDSTITGGGTDDTTALNAAYAAAGVAGTPFVINEGFFRFTSQLFWGKEIDVRGSGRFKCALVKDGTFDGIKIFDSEGSQYSDFSVYGATSNTGLGINVDLGGRITMSEVGVFFMGGGGIIQRAGNVAGFYNLKIHNNGGTAFEVNSGSGSLPGQSANACTYVNLDLNGNDIGLKVTAGAISKYLQIICQNSTTMNAQLVNVSDVERNMVELYTEFEGTSTSDMGGVANTITVAQGQVTNSGTNNRILDFNQAGEEKPQYRELFLAKAIIQDRDADAANSQPWSLFENGSSTLRILRLHSLGSNSRPGLIDIRQPDGNLVNVELFGQMRTLSSVDTTIGTTSGDNTPSVDGANSLIVNGGTISNFDDGTVGQVLRIKAGSATTIQEGVGAIELSGSGNFVMATDDTLTVEQFETGVWSEVGRMVR